MNKYELIGNTYKNIIKPALFTQDAEQVHNIITAVGELVGKNKLTKSITGNLLVYRNKKLNQKIDNIKFENPIGLSAGFDYDGHLSETMYYSGFGFNTVGTVTSKAYGGNPKPRLLRLPKSKSLLVNKGFKSEGAENVKARLRLKNLKEKTVGVSIGSSNLPEINSVDSSIDDYIDSFETFKNESYIKYFELNISCPNTAMTESFSNKKNFEKLLVEIGRLKIKKPIYVKMANEIELNDIDALVMSGIKLGINGFVFSNLVKNRKNKTFDKNELKNVSNYKGNFSGKPTEINANKIIKHIHKEYGNDTTIIGCGGVFTAEDAYEKIKAGANLVQLITGMIYGGPQTAAEINLGLVRLLENDGYKNISEAVGAFYRR